MTRKSEYEAAYFTLLRAREELDHLRRYAEFLDEELARLATFARTVDDAPEVVPEKFRKLVDSTAKPLVEAVGRRRAIVLGERDRIPERISAQEAFVTECEEELAALR
ncbi:hypothetical protein [Euzebya sp.]|uniref:hypothetical protein n=1 Tax=Euzebya sp. TaxID=1971409 RepID=UPI0035188782